MNAVYYNIAAGGIYMIEHNEQISQADLDAAEESDKAVWEKPLFKVFPLNEALGGPVLSAHMDGLSSYS